MKVYHLVSTAQALLAAVAIALLSGASVVAVSAYLNYEDLPIVIAGVDGKCLRVLNFKNGDGYQCQDVDIILRKYRRQLAPLEAK
jgi:hypothetical protein